MIVFGHRQGGYVLIVGRVKIAKNSSHVHHRAHVWTVVASPRQSRVAELSDQIGGCSGGKSSHHRLAMTIVEYELIAVLSQAGGLLFGRLLEALRIQFDA